MQNYFSKPDEDLDYVNKTQKNIYARDRVITIIGSMVLKNNQNLLQSEYNIDNNRSENQLCDIARHKSMDNFKSEQQSVGLQSLNLLNDISNYFHQTKSNTKHDGFITNGLDI